jgi:hypothetical protein
MDVYTKAVMGAFRMLTDSDIHITLVHEDALASAEVRGSLDKLYWPMPSVCDESLAGYLLEFVSQGGTLLAEGSPGEYDHIGRHRPEWPMGALSDLFGARVVDNDITSMAVLNLSGARLAGRWQADRLEVGAARAIGHFADGTVGATVMGRGRGRAILVGTYPSLHYEAERDAATRAAVVQFLEPGGRTPAAAWRDPQPGLFSRSGTSEEGDEVVALLNWTTANQTVEGRGQFVLLDDGGPDDGGNAGGPGTIVVRARSASYLLFPGRP